MKWGCVWEWGEGKIEYLFFFSELSFVRCSGLKFMDYVKCNNVNEMPDRKLKKKMKRVLFYRDWSIMSTNVNVDKQLGRQLLSSTNVNVDKQLGRQVLSSTNIKFDK